jgi:alcohol dehydrogenase class IV
LGTVDTLVRLARGVAAEAIVGVGGGSVIDAAKAAAVLAPLEGSVTEYFRGESEITAPGLPYVAMPTTAGTGAEITRNAVLTDPEAGVKRSLRSPHMVPAAALIDPELTTTMPPALTAHSGLDALTQAVESYTSLRSNAVSRPLAIEAIQRLFSALPAAYRDGSHREARTTVAEGSLLSAMAFSQSGLGAVHGLAHPIGHILNLPHGLTCAVLLPHILRWNEPACHRELEALAAAIGGRSAEDFIEAVTQLCHTLGIPSTFAELGLDKQHVAPIVANCRSGSMAANPKPMSDEDVRELLGRLRRPEPEAGPEQD